jgi:hypothetical protein
MSSPPPVPSRQLYINGTWLAPVQGRCIDVINPATEQIIGSIPAGTAEDVDKAVAAARAAHSSGKWAKQSGKERAVILRSIAAKVDTSMRHMCYAMLFNYFVYSAIRLRAGLKQCSGVGQTIGVGHDDLQIVQMGIMLSVALNSAHHR